MNEPRFTLEVKLRSPDGRTLYAMAVNLEPDECSDMERIVGDMRLSREFDDGSVGGLDEVVRTMRRREFRRDALVNKARLLGMQLADLMEDKDGWHGADRQESAKSFIEGLSRF